MKQPTRHRLLGIMAMTALLVTVTGCSTGQVDYSYQVLKKGADGSKKVVGKGESKRTEPGESGGSEVEGVGRVISGAQSVSSNRAKIRVTWPDNSTADIEFAPRETKEHWHASGDYGIRITVDEIRAK